MARSRSRGPRVARGAIAATLATWVALLSHLAGGGDLPGWLGIAAPWVLAVMVCTLLAGRTLSLVRLSLAVAISQLLFHVLFVLGFSSTGATAAASLHSHAHGAMMLSATTAPLHTGTVMWIAHGVAAFITIAVLHRGEHAVRRLLSIAAEFAHVLASSLRRLVGLVSALGAPLLPRARATTAAADRVLAPLGWHPSSLARRGPPALFAI